MAEKRHLTRIGLMSVAKTGGIVSGLSGLIAGVVIGAWFSFFVALIGASLGHDFSKTGFAALIILPILISLVFAIAGCFISIFLALLYNLAAVISGGIEIEIEGGKASVDKTITELQDEKYRKNAFSLQARPEICM